MKKTLRIPSVPDNGSISVDFRTKQAHDGIWYVAFNDKALSDIMLSARVVTPGLVRVEVHNVGAYPSKPFTVSVNHTKKPSNTEVSS